MIKMYTAALLGFFTIAAHAEGIEEEQPETMPVRLEMPKSETKIKFDAAQGEAEEEKSTEPPIPSDLDPDTSKLSPSERTDNGHSPGAEMRKLNPEYMEVKVLYESSQMSWWERTLENMRNWLWPPV